MTHYGQTFSQRLEAFAESRERIGTEKGHGIYEKCLVDGSTDSGKPAVEDKRKKGLLLMPNMVGGEALQKLHNGVEAVGLGNDQRRSRLDDLGYSLDGFSKMVQHPAYDGNVESSVIGAQIVDRTGFEMEARITVHALPATLHCVFRRIQPQDLQGIESLKFRGVGTITAADVDNASPATCRKLMDGLSGARVGQTGGATFGRGVCISALLGHVGVKGLYVFFFRLHGALYTSGLEIMKKKSGQGFPEHGCQPDKKSSGCPATGSDKPDKEAKKQQGFHKSRSVVENLDFPGRSEC